MAPAMETLLQTAPAADPVAQLLGLLRVRSSVYCRSVMRAPWGFGVLARSVAGFHLVTEGSCWLEVDGEDHAAPLNAGDLVILPRGSAHQVRSDPTASVRLLDDILAEHPVPDGRLDYGGSGPATTILCGGFVLEEPRLNPLLNRLPPIVKVAGSSGRPVPWLGATIELLTGEMTAAHAGVNTLVSRLSELLLVQVLRTYLAELNGNTPPGLQGFADPQIGKAISLMQERPERPWTLDRLAAAVAMSRAAFAGRFRALTGEPPMRYLTRYRLFKAALDLRRSNHSLTRIAASTGYDSEVTLSKAFRRYFGVAPGSYRKSATNGS
jgi:AraC family transcriptional regulator, alkane utilization regulator